MHACRPALWSFALCLVAGLASSCGPSKPAYAGPDSHLPRVGELREEQTACSLDSECELARDCCGCAAGGMKTGVRKDAVVEASEAADDACEGRTCIAQDTSHRSCQAEGARCVGGRCLPAL